MPEGVRTWLPAFTCLHSVMWLPSTSAVPSLFLTNRMPNSICSSLIVPYTCRSSSLCLFNLSKLYSPGQLLLEFQIQHKHDLREVSWVFLVASVGDTIPCQRKVIPLFILSNGAPDLFRNQATVSSSQEIWLQQLVQGLSWDQFGAKKMLREVCWRVFSPWWEDNVQGYCPHTSCFLHLKYAFAETRVPEHFYAAAIIWHWGEGQWHCTDSSLNVIKPLSENLLTSLLVDLFVACSSEHS